MRIMRRSGYFEYLAIRLCSSFAVILLLALNGCSSEDEPTFGGVEEQQAKEAERNKNKAHATTTPH